MSKIDLEYILSSLYSFELQGDQSYRKLILNIHWRDWYWGWSSNTLATWCEESTHWKNPWCWERLKAGGEGDDRGWNGWIASSTQWTWVWASSGRCEEQGSLACCNLWGSKEPDTTETLKNNDSMLIKWRTLSKFPRVCPPSHVQILILQIALSGSSGRGELSQGIKVSTFSI